MNKKPKDKIKKLEKRIRQQKKMINNLCDVLHCEVNMEKPTYIAQVVNISGDISKMQGKVYLLTFDWFGKRVGSLEMKIR